MQTGTSFKMATAAISSLLVLSGCAQPSVSGSPSPSVSRESVVTIGPSANGHTVQVHGGQQIRVVLGAPTEAGSTYWVFADLAGPVLMPDGPQVVKAVPMGSTSGCGSIPGAGCGTVTLVARAASQGTASITAARTTCGEAMMCPQNKRDFRVLVQVIP